MPALAAIDLHLHSALSPCGAAEMLPPAVLLMAEQRGVTTVGIVDHSSAGNAAAFFEAAEAFEVQVLAGLEIESAEGVHLLALFDNLDAAQTMQEQVWAHLPERENRPEILGPQWLVDEYGEVIGEERRLLATATDLTVEQIADATHESEGLSIAAHIDRRSNGLLPTLGLLPPRLQVDLLELSRHVPVEEACRKWPELVGRPLLHGSDAHYLDDIGATVTRVPEELARPSGPLREWGRALATALVTRGVAGL
ncbi:MAG: PHP domain-containing protein [Armatimonadota bacterium]